MPLPRSVLAFSPAVPDMLADRAALHRPALLPAVGAAALEFQRPESLSDVQSPSVTFASISPAVGVGGCTREAEALARTGFHIPGVSNPPFPQTQRELIGDVDDDAT